MERQYNIRPMKSTDVLRLTSVISKIGLKNIQPLISNYLAKANEENANKNDLAIELGLNIIELVLGNLEGCSDSLFRFIEGISDLTVKEIEELDGAEFVAMIMNLFTRKEYIDFFKVALRFRK